MKLSKAQIGVLRVLKDGGELLQTRAGDAFTLNVYGDEETVYKTTFAILVKRRLIVCAGMNGAPAMKPKHRFKAWNLTPAGRQALLEAEGAGAE